MVLPPRHGNRPRSRRGHRGRPRRRGRDRLCAGQAGAPRARDPAAAGSAPPGRRILGAYRRPGHHLQLRPRGSPDAGPLGVLPPAPRARGGPGRRPLRDHHRAVGAPGLGGGKGRLPDLPRRPGGDLPLPGPPPGGGHPPRRGALLHHRGRPHRLGGRRRRGYPPRQRLRRPGEGRLPDQPLREDLGLRLLAPGGHRRHRRRSGRRPQRARARPAGQPDLDGGRLRQGHAHALRRRRAHGGLHRPEGLGLRDRLERGGHPAHPKDRPPRLHRVLGLGRQGPHPLPYPRRGHHHLCLRGGQRHPEQHRRSHRGRHRDRGLRRRPARLPRRRRRGRDPLRLGPGRPARSRHRRPRQHHHAFLRPRRAPGGLAPPLLDHRLLERR